MDLNTDASSGTGPSHCVLKSYKVKNLTRMRKQKQQQKNVRKPDPNKMIHTDVQQDLRTTK